MMLSTSFGPGLTAEIAYRRERILEAAQGSRRVRRGRSGRVARAVSARRAAGRVGAPHPAR